MARISSRECLCDSGLTPMATAPLMRMKKRLSGNSISNALIAIVTANWIEMKDGMHADDLIALKIAGTVGKMRVTAGKIDGTAKKMFANSKEIGAITEEMSPAVADCPAVAKIISPCSCKNGSLDSRVTVFV
jgi:hypothetical protein